MIARFTQINKASRLQHLTVIGIICFLLIHSFSLNAQHKSFEESLKVEIGINDSRYMQVHDDYKRHIHPIYYQKNYTQRNTQNDFTFLLDTVYVNSVSTNQKRYSYTYSEEGYRLTSLNEKYENGTWEFVNFEICSYDSIGNKITSIWRIWDNGSFVNASKNTFVYTTNGNVVTFVNEVWENGAWVSNSRSNYLYNTAGNVVSHLSELWENSTWVNNYKELYIYDDNSNMLLAFGDVWADTVWHNDIKYSYTYDSSGNMLTGINQEWGIIDWENIAHETYTYDEANNRLSYLGEMWSDTIWINSNKIGYSYNALDYLETSIAEIWSNGTWNNTQKESYSYSTYGGVESLLIEAWEDFNWVNFSLSQYNYDEYGNSLSGQYYSWDGAIWTQNMDGLLELNYNYSTEVEYFIGYNIEGMYSSILVDVNQHTNIDITDIYFGPNPSKGRSTLLLNIDASSYVDVSLYSVNGRFLNKIHQGEIKAGQHSFTIITTDIPNGLYFIKIAINNQIKVIKVIIAN